MDKCGKLTRENFLEGIRIWEEEDKKGRIFEKYYWEECQKQYEDGLRRLKNGEILTFKDMNDMICEAGNIARQKMEEEWLNKE